MALQQDQTTDHPPREGMSADEVALVALSAELASLDDRRDDMIARQRALIKKLRETHPDLSYRYIGALARMSHQNVALITGWKPPVPVKNSKAKPSAKRAKRTRKH